MDLLPGEEKKEGGDFIGVGGSAKESAGTNDDDDDEIEELGNLPPEIAERIGSRFESEEALQAALVKAGVGDLPVVLLDGKPRLIMPSDQHNTFTSSYIMNFEHGWSKNRWGSSSATHTIHLPNGRSRDPDLSYWGYPICQRDKHGFLKPVGNMKGCVPDVIIQFSWKNKAQYEEDAIDDMMNRALEEDCGATSTTRPTLGYLIKVRFSRKRTLPGAIKGSNTQDIEGLDIYRLPHGTTIDDARDPNNPNASHWGYVPGGPEHFITITPRDLGISGFWGLLCGEYSIKASDLFEEMQQAHQIRQAVGLAT